MKDKMKQMKGPTIQVPKDIKLLPSRPNETLMSVKTNKFGEVTCAKYTTATPRVAFDGVRAAPRQIKIIPPKETPKRSAPAPLEREEKRQRMTVAALEKRVDLLTQAITTLQEKTHLLTRTIEAMHNRMESEHLQWKNLKSKISILSRCLGDKKQN